MIEAFVTEAGTIYTAYDVVQSDITTHQETRPVHGFTPGNVRSMTFHEIECRFTFKTPISDIREGLTGSISYDGKSYNGSILRISPHGDYCEVVADGKRLLKID